MKLKLFLCGCLALSTSLVARDRDEANAGFRNAVILVIRHAENPASGTGLSPAGQERAQAYVNYFKNYTVGSTPLKLDYLYATADSSASHRPRLTITPLSQALGLAIDGQFKDDDYEKVVRAVRDKPAGKQFLFCWHHGNIPQLVKAFGGNSDALFPNKKWPDAIYDWVIQLRYDANGQLIEIRRTNEKLMPGDSGN